MLPSSGRCGYRQFMKQIFLVLAFLIFTLAAPLYSQRNALGHRLQALESVWGPGVKDEARRRALPKINEAVRAFFTFRMAKAGQSLDQARLLVAAEGIDPALEYAASLKANLKTRLIDPAIGKIEVQVDAFYKAGKRPENLMVKAWLRSEDGALGKPLALSGADLPLSGTLPPAATAAALDCELCLLMMDGEKELGRLSYALALVPELEVRLEELAQAAEIDADSEKLDWRRATIEMIANDLSAWRDGKEPEEEPKMAAMLIQAEALVKADAGAQLSIGESRIHLPVGKRLVRCRVAVPKGDDAERPLVLLLHGAGGSESMFFEALGRGVYVQEGLKRGAVVMAPKIPLLGSLDLVAVIDSLRERVVFDKSKVFVVGHSMGAGLALNAARRNPERFKAIAALAGGRPMRGMEALSKLPIFLGTGTEDFGRDGILSLARELKELRAPKLVVVDHPLTEHLMLVQDLVGGVFSFFDE